MSQPERLTLRACKMEPVDYQGVRLWKLVVHLSFGLCSVLKLLEFSLDQFIKYPFQGVSWKLFYAQIQILLSGLLWGFAFHYQLIVMLTRIYHWIVYIEVRSHAKFQVPMNPFSHFGKPNPFVVCIVCISPCLNNLLEPHFAHVQKMPWWVSYQNISSRVLLVWKTSYVSSLKLLPIRLINFPR